MKKDELTNKVSLRIHTTVSPEEIIAAGGTTAFGLKSGKNNDTIIKSLENSAKPEPFSNTEWEDILKQLAEHK